MNTTIVLVLALVACVVCVACAVALFFLLRNKGNDPYKDLPTEPIKATLPLPQSHPAYKPLIDRMQGNINALFQVQSDCWHVNHVYRKMIPELSNAINADALADIPLPNLPWERLKDSKEMKKLANRAAFFAQWGMLEKAKQELRKCSRDTVIKSRTGQWTVGDFLDGKVMYM